MNKTIFSFLIIFFVAAALSAPEARAQRRDYMTDAEIELVREAQDIDLRVAVLTQMIDRRLAALSLDPGAGKVTPKNAEKWGPAPEGTRLQLLTDIRNLLQKAIDDIDDVAEHSSIAQAQNKKEGPLFPKAVRNLSAAAQRYKMIFKPLVDKASDQKERGILLASIESCDLILEAATQLPAETTKRKN